MLFYILEVEGFGATPTTLLEAGFGLGIQAAFTHP